MVRFFVFIFKLVIWLLLLALVIATGTVLVVDPNRYKPQIIELIEERTGHKAEIKGSIQWSLFPSFNVKAQDFILLNQKGTERLLEAKEAKIVVKPVDYLLTVFKYKDKHEVLLKLNSSVLYGLNTKFNLESKVNIDFTPKVALDVDLQLLPIGSSFSDTKDKIIPLSVKIEVNARQANLFINEKNVDMANVSKMFFADQLISGTGDIKATIVTDVAIKDLPHWIQHLSGNVELSIANGKAQGIDVHNYLGQAEQSLNNLFNNIKANNKQSVDPLLSSNQQVNNSIGREFFSSFSNLKMQATFNKGVASQSSIVLQDAVYNVHGTGVIDLDKNNLEYKCNASLIKTADSDAVEVARYVQAVPLLINVHGDVNGLNFSLDYEGYLKNGLQELQKGLAASDVVHQ